MSEQATIPETEEDTDRTGRGMDDELKAIAAILRLLDRQEVSARARIVTYISSRFKE